MVWLLLCLLEKEILKEYVNIDLKKQQKQNVESVCRLTKPSSTLARFSSLLSSRNMWRWVRSWREPMWARRGEKGFVQPGRVMVTLGSLGVPVAATLIPASPPSRYPPTSHVDPATGICVLSSGFAPAQSCSV